jgi:hypothetical protein
MPILGELINVTLDVSGNTTFTTAISGDRFEDLDIQVIANGLDSDVELEQLQGLENDINKMSPVINADSADISDLIKQSLSPYFITSKVDGIFFGLRLNPLLATTGTLTIIIRI